MDQKGDGMPPAAGSAEVYTIAADGVRKLDMGVLDLANLLRQVDASIEALKHIRFGLPVVLSGDGQAEISLDSRHRLAEIITGTSEDIELALQATCAVFDMLPATSSAKPSKGGSHREEWHQAMRAPVERIIDLVSKVRLLNVVANDPDEYGSGVTQILLDLEALEGSAVAVLPIYPDRRDDGDIHELHKTWSILRGSVPPDDGGRDEWARDMTSLVDRIMMFPAWNATARRLKFEVLRAEFVPLFAMESALLDPRFPLWLAALEIDATRKIA